MRRKLVITQWERRKLLLDFQESVCNGIQVLSHDSECMVGNIYIGRVENVVKNINAAFIEIQKGVKCYYSLNDNKSHIFLNPKNNQAVNIGDKLLIQINREAIKTKPATATCKLEIPGKYVVISLDVKGVSVSSKIKKEPDVKAMKEQLQKLLSAEAFPFGMIIRTNAVSANPESVIMEVLSLGRQFLKMLEIAQYGSFYQKMYSAVPTYCTYINDIKTENIEKIITDDSEIYHTIIEKIPDLDQTKLQLYKDSMLQLNKLYSVDTILKRSTDKKVWLKSGGYLIIEQTEAMVVVDVNSGKQASSKSKAKANQEAYIEESFYKTNCEAALELAKQLRLRNLSGIIIVDFINMKEDTHKQELLRYLKQMLREDPITTTVIDITKLGLVEITRKKSGKCLTEALMTRQNSNMEAVHEEG